MLLLKWLWVKRFFLSQCSENILVEQRGKSTDLRAAEHTHPKSISLPNAAHACWSPVAIRVQRSTQADAWWPGQIHPALTGSWPALLRKCHRMQEHPGHTEQSWLLSSQLQLSTRAGVCTPLHICATSSVSLSELHSPKSHFLNPRFSPCSNKLLASTNDKDLSAGHNSLCNHDYFSMTPCKR